VNRLRSTSVILLGLILLVGCVGRFEYVRPARLDPPEESLTVEKSKSEAWAQIIQALDNHLFTIDCLDKDSGTIVLTYVGDPERYIDCGSITSYVKNLGGERTYSFPAAAGATEYELMQWDGLLLISRQMNLEARLNVTVAEMDATRTRISVHARYAVTRTLTVRDTQGRPRNTSNVILFNSSQESAFPGTGTCRPTGLLEKDVLLSARR
jgi:hypothetical protein